LSITVAFAQLRTDNVIIVTLDGFRWQELFSGADPTMLFNKEFCSNSEVQQQFWTVQRCDDGKSYCLSFGTSSAKKVSFTVTET
jgi:hypothetical protein